MVEFSIDGKKIGGDNPCYSIAEAGANHDGEIEKAIQLIDSAKNAHADSIKFQNYKASKLSTKLAPKYWDDGNPNETQFEVFSKLDTLSDDDWKQIFEYAIKKQITCFSTPFDQESVDLLYSLNVPAFKIASADITHFPLISYIAKKNLPIFLSTGMASFSEIHDAVNIIENEGNHQIILMHCMTSYPTLAKDANLQMISSLKEEFNNYVIGYSDHTIGTSIPVFSTFYGSKCIEKHFTFNTKLKKSPDHRMSLDENGFYQMISKLRLSEITKGKSIRTNFDSEDSSIMYARRSIVSKNKILKGTKISEEMLDFKRPGTGISPSNIEKIIGLKTIKDIEEDVPIKWEDFFKKSND